MSSGVERETGQIQHPFLAVCLLRLSTETREGFLLFGSLCFRYSFSFVYVNYFITVLSKKTFFFLPVFIKKVNAIIIRYCHTYSGSKIVKAGTIPLAISSASQQDSLPLDEMHHAFSSVPCVDLNHQGAPKYIFVNIPFART